MDISKIKTYKFVDCDFIAFGKSYLAGLLGALTVFAVMHWIDAKPYKIGTVNITRMVDRFVKEESAKNISPDLIKNDVKVFGDALDTELKRVSEEYRLILLPSEAVISGSKDYTAMVRARISNNKHRDLTNAD